MDSLLLALSLALMLENSLHRVLCPPSALRQQLCKAWFLDGGGWWQPHELQSTKDKGCGVNTWNSSGVLPPGHFVALLGVSFLAG